MPFATMVCPALLPPALRAQTSADSVRISTSFPLPSSPNWVPRTIVTFADDMATVVDGRHSRRAETAGKKGSEWGSDVRSNLSFQLWLWLFLTLFINIHSINATAV